MQSRPRNFKQGILIVASLFFLVLLIVKNVGPKEIQSQTKKRPQEYMKNVFVWQYTQAGTLKHYINAEYWAYLPAQKASRLEKPRMVLYKPNQEQWHVQSNHGLVYQQSLDREIEKIDLWEQVEIDRKPTKTLEPFALSTEQLNYRPKTQALTSDKFVTLIKPNLKITGIGLKGNLKQNKMELQKNVKTEYLTSKTLMKEIG